jgi:NitT/TauT family transport system permease protein
MDMPPMNRSLLLKLLSAALVFGAWEVAGRIPISYAFPTFFEATAALARTAFDGTLLQAYAETLKPLVLGVAISGVLGIGFGLWIGLSARSGGSSRRSSSSCRRHPLPRSSRFWSWPTGSG